MNFRACFSSSRVVARFCMEAAGIEPASRDISMPASTCIVGCLGFAELALTDEVQLRLAENLI